ncbi:MAG: dicarboxylate/amino acid:cation symporter [Prevotella sp.]|nr:dicarboxylate/amino acid:cation symporter [Candidatus Prevotella equi]
MKNVLVWIGALVVGAGLGMLGMEWINNLADFVATVYTRLFQFVAVPTIALAITITLANLGGTRDTGKLFRRTLLYTLLTTFAAAFVGLAMFLIVEPGNLPQEMIAAGMSSVPENLGSVSYYDHILSVVPNNIVKPFIEGNVLSVLLISFAVGICVNRMPEKESKQTLLNLLVSAQKLLFMLINALIYILPIGIVAYAAQLSAYVESGIIVGSLGKYVLVILGGNAIQFFVVLPLFLLARGLNPLKVAKAMYPALLMALFTKSSAATLPVTMSSAEERMKAKRSVTRFVLPICTTINMNGCAAFILVTSLFVMQNGGMQFDWMQLLMWVCIAVISAVGNAGVPMGCYFLTLSLVAGIGALVWIMGVILPIFTVIDMLETAENVWSDSCVCAMVDKDVD